MKLLFFLLIFFSILNAAQVTAETNTSKANENTKEVVEPDTDTDTSNIIRLKDSSGLSDEEVRKIAEEVDNNETISIMEERDHNRSKGSSKQNVKQVWEQLSPAANSYDWIELTSGEWLRGEFKFMYRKKLEFDSKKMKLHTFDFKDIKQIRTHNVITLSMVVDDNKDPGIFGFKQTKIEIIGILRLEEQKVVVIRGDGRLEFDRKQIISIAQGSERELDFWSGKITIGIDMREGNTKKFEYTTKAEIKRRTPITRLHFEYLGNVLNTNDTETANNHRLNDYFDIFVTKYFFYTPLFSEYYSDVYQNIRSRYTAGIGLGYTIFDTPKVDWDVSGGPALLYTIYDTVESGKEKTDRASALELSTAYKVEITNNIDFRFDYKMTITERSAGTYHHHMVTALENELTGWFDIDVTFVWDYILHPEPNNDNTLPEQNDYQFVISMGIDF